MIELTKCDLSAGIAKVDYWCLVETLKMFLHVQIKDLNNRIKEYDPTENKRAAFACTCHGHILDYVTKEIRQTAELLYTLENANPFDTTEDKREIQWVQ